ncbi:MAG: hypothetical protein R6V77_02785, partial [Candidatus Cloacimonadaceae bacterium]
MLRDAAFKESENAADFFHNQQIGLQRWQEQVNVFDDLIEKIANAFTEKPPLNITEGGIFKQGYHSELDELLLISHDG